MRISQISLLPQSHPLPISFPACWNTFPFPDKTSRAKWKRDNIGEKQHFMARKRSAIVEVKVFRGGNLWQKVPGTFARTTKGCGQTFPSTWTIFLVSPWLLRSVDVSSAPPFQLSRPSNQNMAWPASICVVFVSRKVRKMVPIGERNHPRDFFPCVPSAHVWPLIARSRVS